MDILPNARIIAGKIESLITDAKDEVILISPYIQLSKTEDNTWESVKRAIKSALINNVHVHVYARDVRENSWEKLREKFKEFEGMNISLNVVKNLHAKLFYNGDEAIICSMNMYKASHDNFEIGVSIKRQNHENEIRQIENFVRTIRVESVPVQFAGEKERQILEGDEKDNVVHGFGYTKTHQWVGIDGDVATVGITDFAQEQLGEIIYVELKWDDGLFGTKVTAVKYAGDTPVSDPIDDISVGSEKAVGDIYSPLSGVVIAVNELLQDEPGKINTDPYGEGWLFKIRLTNFDEEKGNLLNEDQYNAFCEMDSEIKNIPQDSYNAGNDIEGYCMHCAKPLKGKSKLCYECNQSQAKINLIYCRKCGRQSDGLRFNKPLCYTCYLQEKGNNRYF